MRDKVVRLLVFAAVFFLPVCCGWADSIPTTDPKLIVSTGVIIYTPEETNNFSFVIGAGGTGMFPVENATPQTWSTMLITGPANGPIDCQLFAFWGLCGTTSGPTTSILLSGNFDGAPTGADVLFNFTSNSGTWTPGTYNFQANNLPEPASVILLLTGLAGMMTRRRRCVGGKVE